MNIKYEYVRSMRLAGYLMQQGFKILKITQNIKFPDKDVYVFEQSEELSNCILEYIRTKEKYHDFNQRSSDKIMGQNC